MARNRAGMAMATALGGLVIIGVMIAGVFFTSNQELRAGTNTFVQERAFRAAEFGLNASLASWDSGEMVLLALGGKKEIVYDSSAQGWRDSVTITRLNATSYLIVSTGTAFGGIQGEARRRNALLVRLSVPIMEFPGALTVRGASKIGGSSEITGFDTNPVGWTSCPAAVDSKAALATEPGAIVAISGGNKVLQGLLPHSVTPAAGLLATYFEYKDENWSSLTAYATKVYEGSQTFSQNAPVLASDGTCDRSAAQNWGDPSGDAGGACRNYFPIIHVKGSSASVSLSGGIGQGILLVDGDLDMTGSFSFYGPIVVRGTIKSAGGGSVGHIRGGVMAANMKSGENSVLGNSRITYSSCAIYKAVRGAIPPKRVVERAWMEVF